MIYFYNKSFRVKRKTHSVTVSENKDRKVLNSETHLIAFCLSSFFSAKEKFPTTDETTYFEVFFETPTLELAMYIEGYNVFLVKELQNF